MKIRRARPTDAKSIATHIMLAMSDIVYSYIGEHNDMLAIDFLMHFIQKRNNQYSYQNCFVAEVRDEVIATVNIYNGSRLSALRQPVLSYITKNFNRDLAIEDETQAGEMYIDTLGVSPSQQGKGVGLKMLQYLINEIVIKDRQSIGLLVDKHHPNAKKLYLKAGFKPVGTKMLLNTTFEHLQIKVGE